MKKSKTILPLIFLALSIVLVLPSLVPRARAATGLVCIADPSLNPASCPSSPASLQGTLGSTISVAVNLQGSDSLNGFDISVQVNPSVLQPVNITFVNSVIHSPNFVQTESANSTTGIARLAIVALGYVVTGPVTGNLFDINYKVLSSNSGTEIVFQAGCSGTSVPNICVTVVNPNLDSELVQTASFGGPVPPNFTITANPSSQNVQQGSTATSTIVLASISGFAGTVSLFTSPPPLCPSCPSWGVSPNTVALSSGGTGTATLTFITTLGTPTLTFAVNVTGTSGSLSHSVVVSFTVVSPPPPPTPDFKISANPVTLNIVQGSSGQSTVTFSSVNGFSGAINQTLIVTPPGPTASVNPKIVLLASGGSNSSTLTVITSSFTAPGTYNVTVIGNSGSLTHSVAVFAVVTVPATPGIVCIALASSTSCPPTPVMFQGTVGGTLVVAVNVQSSAALNGFDIQVSTNPTILQPINDSLTGTVLQNPFVVANSVNAATGLVRVAAASQTITTAPTTGRFFSITYNIVGSTQGTYILFPNGCSGTSIGNTCVTVVNAGVIDPENILEANFTSAQPDFTMSANPSSLAIQAGTSATSIVSITSINGFAGTVSLSTNTGPLIICPPACSTWSVSPTSVTLTPGGTATAILTIKVSSFGGGGSGFTVIVFGTSGSLSHSVSVVFTVIPPPTFSITANPSSVAVRQGQTGSSALNVTSLNGFNGTVTLSMSIQPLIKKGPAISLSTTTINLASGVTATVTLGIATNGATQLGIYTVTVTATSGSLVQTVTVTVTIIARR